MSNEPEGYEELISADWWGIATMFRCPHDTDPKNSDIALVGVPHSSGNALTYRDQHLGPRALRDVAVGYRRIHKKFQLSPWEACRINDLGDVPLAAAGARECGQFVWPLSTAADVEHGTHANSRTVFRAGTDGIYHFATPFPLGAAC